MRMPRKIVSLVTSASLVLPLVPVPPSVAYAEDAKNEVEEYVVAQDEGGEEVWEEQLPAYEDPATDEGTGDQHDAPAEEGVAPDGQPDSIVSSEEVVQDDGQSQDTLAEEVQPAEGEELVAGPLDEDAFDETPDQSVEWVDDSVEGPLTATEDYDPMPTGNTAFFDQMTHDLPRNSYLHKNANGDVERVEYTGGKLLVETLSNDLTSVVGQRYIATSTFAPSNLASDSNFRWGGFFSGSQYNFVVTGQTNYDENDSLAVYRITKYTKDWSYVSYAELYGANTVAPFDAGTCFMAENGSTLHVRTCHTMYKSSDGYNHQANVHIVIDEPSMSITTSQTGVMNQVYTNYGYVSHSFAQRVTNLNGTMYGLDLGDAYPRSVTIKKLGGYYGCLDVLPITGDKGNNFTGVTLGGFEASESTGNLLSSGVSINQSAFSSAGSYTPRNAYISISSSDLSSNDVRYLTAFDSSGTRGAAYPKMVKINDNRFLVIWSIVDYQNPYDYESRRRGSQTGEIGFAFVDGNGNPEGSNMHGSAMLSSCDPIVYGNYAIWYAQDINGSNAPMYYGIDLTTGEVKRVDLRLMSNVQKGTIATQTYTGEALKPSPVLSYNGKALVEGRDYSIQRYSDNVDAGTASITVEGINRYTGTATVTFTIAPISVAIPKAKTGLTYDGSTKTGVAAGSNYSLSGTTEAIAAGTYTATAQLKDTTNYRWSDGTKTAQTLSWKIARASIATATVTAANKAYTGKAIESVPTVKLGSATLKAGTDYTVKYDNNTVVGTATITVTGKGNYTGTAKGTFKVTRAKVKVPVAKTGLVYTGKSQVGVPTGTGYRLTGTVKATAAGSYTATASLADAKNQQWADGTTAKKSISWTIGQAAISAATATVAAQTYTGKALKPAPTVTFNGATLASGTDYTLAYANNTNVGTATVTITGKGNFTGTKKVTFKVNPKSISKATVDAIAAQTYSGKALKPKVVVKNAGVTLVSGTDYTLAYTNNVNAGTATVTITGKGNFGGTKKATFKISPAAMSKATIDAIANRTYTGSALKPAPIVKFGSTTLKADTDYTVAYENNTNVGIATVTVTGKGNFTGTKSATFKVVATKIAGATATVPDQTYTGKALKPAPTVTFNGATLASGTDYTLAYANNTNVGTATVTITGKGNFTGTKKVTFKVKAKPISGATVAKVANQTFKGVAIKPSLTVKDGSKTLKAGTDYTVTYANNVNAGTATATITGKGNYTSTKKVYFRIAPASIAPAKVTGLGNYAYTGKALGPTPEVTLGSASLKKGTDYSVAYANNTKVGTATVTLTGRGNYAGTVAATFGIVDAIPMYRMYNPHSGEHLYTKDPNERDGLVRLGWNYEGVGWHAPKKSGTEVHRLYNRHNGDHHYTKDANEKDALVRLGWTYEGVCWYSDDAETVPLYRQFNPNVKVGSHNYTTDKGENDFLVKIGWHEEGISWYGVK